MLLIVEMCLLRSSYEHFIYIIFILLFFVCAVSVLGHLTVGAVHTNKELN
jgi:hypothetical protein